MFIPHANKTAVGGIRDRGPGREDDRLLLGGNKLRESDKVAATIARRGDARRGRAGQQAITSSRAKLITSLIELNAY